tara:strand:+ start:491 stop:2746 length:2256 start_codon:yes stop_codon:yes gene_type:complete
MKTQTFQVFRLRGMDDRWRVTADQATEIKEMSWDINDGWKTAGAFDPVTADAYDWGFTNAHGVIHSIHYYGRHNGAKRHIVFEDEKGRLAELKTRTFAYGGDPPYASLYDSEGNQWDATTRTRFVPTTSYAGTQSVTFGGRLYMVNGMDEPVCFDGRTTSRAGFSAGPSAPTGSVIYRAAGAFSPMEEEDQEATTDFFLGTRVRGQGLGSTRPRGAYNKFNKRWIDGKLCGYQYRVSFVNKRAQEGPLSETSNLVEFECCDGKRRFTHVTIPVGGPDVVARRIYRTRDIYDDNGDAVSPQEGRNFYFIKEIQENESTVFEDGIADSNVGGIRDPEDFGPWPTQARYLAAFKNTMFIAGMTDNRIRFSAPGMPEVFPDDNVFEIGETDSGEVTGLYATSNALVAFKSRGIYLIKGDPVNGFHAQTLNKDIGCIAPNSIANVPQVGLLFLGRGGIFSLQGALENTGTPTNIVDMSTPIKKLVDRIDDSATNGAVGVINRRDKEYWLCVPTIGKKNNLLLVFHYDVGAWSYRENYPIQCATETRDHRAYIYFGSNSGYSATADLTVWMPGIHVYSTGFRIKNESGSTLTGGASAAVQDYPLYETAPIDFGSVYSGVSLGYVNCYAVAYGDEPIKVNFKINRSITEVLPETRDRKQQDLLEPLTVYGDGSSARKENTARWDSDTSKWGYHRPIPIRFDVSHMHKGLATEFQIQFKQDSSSTNANRMQIVGWDLEAKVGEQRNIRTLTDVLTVDKR